MLKVIEDLRRVHENILFCNTAHVDYTPQRVVSLQPSATAILRDLGRLDRLVACTKYCVEVCPEVAQSGIRIVPDSWCADSSLIASAKPDLVIAAVPYQEKSVAEILKSGARFLGLAPKSLADIYGDMAMIAAIMDARDKGDHLIRAMQECIVAVRAQAKGLPRRRVFCEEWSNPLIASQPWVAELVEAAGGEFIGVPGTKISFAEVKSAVPDVLIAAWCGAGDRVPLEKIIAARNWEQTPAARSHRVCCIRDEYLNTPARTLIRGLHALAAAIHPEHFPQAEGLRWINKD
jgi:iron complex transport system substrate-binding protein